MKRVFFRYLAVATVFLGVALVSSCKKEEMCMVKFMSDGNVVFQFQVVKGSKLSEPNVSPDYNNMSNYILGGWFTDEHFTTNPWDFANNVVTNDITLYARWNVTVCKVTFISDGSIVDQISVEYGNKFQEPNVSKWGYTLDGWYSDANYYYGFWNFATDVVTYDLTLYAKWIEIAQVRFRKVSDGSNFTITRMGIRNWNNRQILEHHFGYSYGETGYYEISEGYYMPMFYSYSWYDFFSNFHYFQQGNKYTIIYDEANYPYYYVTHDGTF